MVESGWVTTVEGGHLQWRVGGWLGWREGRWMWWMRVDGCGGGGLMDVVVEGGQMSRTQ